MDKLSIWLIKNSGKILVGMIGVYVLVVSAICFWKYQHFLYDGLDLAIFNNALWNTVHGNWWWSTIQGHNYWGDHFEPILVLILPIYYLWQSPITLLILQTMVLGLAAWPLFLISSVILNKRQELISTQSRTPFEHGTDAEQSRTNAGTQQTLARECPPLFRGGGPLLRDEGVSWIAKKGIGVPALGLAFLWLINPLVHNINLYEFHAIAFLPLFFFWLFYYYLRLKEQFSRKLFSCFLVFLFSCLAVREDVAFIVLIFLILAGIEAFKKKNKILLRVTSYQLLVTILYLIISLRIVGHFSPSGFSPFAYYYGWLKDFNLGIILKHLLTLPNLEMLLGFLAPFFFLPIIKPKWLLLAIIPLAQIIFSAAGGGAVVWQIHYVALFLPALVIAFIYSWQTADNYVIKKIQSPGLLLAIIIIFNLALGPSFGPWNNENKNSIDGAAIQTMINKIEPGASVVASFRLLPNLSSRKEIYALHYYFLGVQQFAQAEYIFDEEPKYILLDKNDYQYFDEILKTSAWAGPYYDRGYERLETLLTNYEKIAGDGAVSLWKNLQ